MEIYLKKTNTILKWMILIASIILLILVWTYKLDNCDYCKFEYNQTKLNANKFMVFYHQKCLDSPKDLLSIPLNLQNQTANNFP